MRRKKQEASRTLLVAAALILGAALAQPLIAQDRGTAKARGDARAAARFDQYFRKYGKRYFGVGYDWRRFKAQAMAESNMDSTATSAVGARGLMQLMPSTFAAIQSARPEFANINDPEWNIAAGIMHDRYLWKLWGSKDAEDDRARFMFGSYNAGEGPIKRANEVASTQDPASPWALIETVAPQIPRWRYKETLGYVRKIDGNFTKLVSGSR